MLTFTLKPPCFWSFKSYTL